jgi:hypothetical protein
VNRNTSDGSADEYAALSDPRQVMTEVLGLVEDLRQATHKLGDAIVAGGLGAREWRSPDARLALLSDQFPDITVDELITRLSEFSGLGPDWLHGGEGEIAHFNEEVEILYGVVYTLRVQAQRLRMLPTRERSDWPLERALGDAHAGTPLDLLLGALRDLESLAPYLVPLTAEEWKGESSPSLGSAFRDSLRSPQPVDDIEAPDSLPQPSQSFTRLRDFVELRTASTGDAELRIQVPRLPLTNLPLTKWIFVAVAIITLASGTLLLSMASRFDVGKSSEPAPSTVLIASPSHATLTCSGTGRTLDLVLRNSGTAALTWSIKAPTGLTLSSTHGVLAPKEAARLQIKVSSFKAARGTLTFTSNHGPLSVPYSVTCG